MVKQDVLQSVDILVCLKLCLPGNAGKSFLELAKDTGISSSTLHRAAKRAQEAGLLKQDRSVNRTALLNFLKYGIKYAFYISGHEQVRGMPTAYAAPPLNDLMQEAHDIPVWPEVIGKVRGFAVPPLHPDAPTAARRDPALYELLALVDAIRIGNAREYKLATEILEKRLKSEPVL